MKSTKAWDYWPPGRNYQWWPKREIVDKITTMLDSGDDEMKALGMVMFYQVNNIWEDDGLPLRKQRYTLGRTPRVVPINWDKLLIVCMRLNELKNRMGYYDKGKSSK